MDNKVIGTENNIVFYEDENNNTKVEVRLLDEDVWLNVNAIAKLFNVGRPAITKHINIEKILINKRDTSNPRLAAVYIIDFFVFSFSFLNTSFVISSLQS